MTVSNQNPIDTPVRCAASEGYFRLRTAAERVAALLVLIACGPIFLWLIWRVRTDSPGPALFQQTRAGRFGRPFTLYKFRTMRTDADPYGDSPQSGEDPRLTPLGRWLRERSLDELPQLLNVVRGEMSLLGPRPLYMQQMEEWDARQRGRLLVKPGLTGLAQISGRGSLTIEDKLELDVRYVETVSLKTDLWILWRTVVGVFKQADIYEKQYSRTRARRGGDDDDDDARAAPPPSE